MNTSELLWGLLVKGSLVVVVAWALCLSLRRGSAASRHAVWLGALGVLVLLPLASVLPAWNVSTERTKVVAPLLPPSVLSSKTAAVLDSPHNLSNAPHAFGVGTFLAGVWVLGFVGSLTWFGIGMIRVRRMVRSGTLSGQRHGNAQTVLCPELAIPATAGFINPVILLPAASKDWDEQRLGIVMSHELAHIERGDWLWQSVGRLSCAIHWFNPLAWLAARNLRNESEFASDDLVLGTGIEATEYAQALLQIAKAARHNLAQTVSMAQAPAVEGRLRAIVDVRRKRGRTSVRVLAASAGCMMALSIPIAVLHAVPSQGQVEKDPKSALEAIERRYESLQAFEATIVHHDDSGLYPGDYEQTLTWTKPATFTLKVTKPSKDQERHAGTFTCDGVTVHTTGSGYDNSDRPLNTDANVSPGYEVSGGPVMSWLLRSPSADLFLNPPGGMKETLTWGQSKDWHGVKVRVIQVAIATPQGASQKLDMFVNDRADELIGYEFERAGKIGYLLYTDQKLTEAKP